MSGSAVFSGGKTAERSCVQRGKRIFFQAVLHVEHVGLKVFESQNQAAKEYFIPLSSIFKIC